MAIERRLELRIQGDKSALSAPLYVYKGDRGIVLWFKIMDFTWDFSGTNLLRTIDTSRVSPIVVKPNGESFRTPVAPVVNNEVKFTITKDLTDELSEIGVYTLQFNFYGDNDSRITIPPITFEVRELIADVADGGMSQTNYSNVNETIVKEGDSVVNVRWEIGELITADKLNWTRDKALQAEQKASGNSSKISLLQGEVTALSTKVDELDIVDPIYVEKSGVGSVSFDNSQDGFTKNISIKGHTLHNIKELSIPMAKNGSISNVNDVYRCTSDGSNGSFGYLQFTFDGKQFLKSNKTYVMVVKKYNYNVASPQGIRLYDRTSNGAVGIFKKVEGNIFTITTPNELNSNNLIQLLFYAGNSANNYVEVSNEIIIIESDDTSNLPTEYFEGVKSLGEQEENTVKLKSVGKNLFNKDSEYKIVSGNPTIRILENGIYYKRNSSNNVDRVEFPIELKKGNYTANLNNSSSLAVYVGNSNTETRIRDRQKFTILENCSYIAFSSNNVGGEASMDNLMIYVGDAIAENYKPHQESNSTFKLPFNSGLKGLSNSTDTAINNKIIQKIDTYTFVGSETISLETSKLEDCLKFVISGDWSLFNALGGCVSNNFVEGTDEIKNSIRLATNNKIVFIIEKTKLSSQDVVGLKKWFRKNQTIIYYERKDPIVYDILVDSLSTFKETTHFYQENNILGGMSVTIPENRDAVINSNTIKIRKVEESLEDTFDYLSGKIPVYAEFNGEDITVVDSMEDVIRDVQIEGKTLLNIYNPNYCSGASTNLKDDRFWSVIADGTWNASGSQYGHKRDSWLPYYKPNTTYTVVSEVAENTLQGTGDLYKINIPSGQLRIFPTSVTLPQGYTGIYVVKLTTLSNFDELVHGFYPSVTTSAKSGRIRVRHMIFEGDLTNYPTKYFEGLLSVGVDKTEWCQGSIGTADGLPVGAPDRIRTNFKRILGSTIYLKNIAPFNYHLFLYDENKTMINRLSTWNPTKVENASYVLPSDAYYYRILLRKNDTDNIYPYEAINVKIYTENENAIRLKSIGRNLLDITNFRSHSYLGTNTRRLRLIVKPNTYYTCSSDVPQTVPSTIYFQGASTDTNGVSANKPRTFVSNDRGELDVYIRINNESGYTLEDFERGIFQLQLEEGKKNTGFEQYREDAKFIKLPFYDGLKATPNIKDSYNEKNNTITENCGEIVLDGSNGTTSLRKTGVNTITFDITGLVSAISSWSDGGNLICDRFKSDSSVNFYNPDKEGCAIDSSDKIVIQILKSKLTTQDVKGFNEWLSKNPTTLIYRKKHPLTHNIVDKYNLKCYKEATHIQQDNEVKTNLNLLAPVSLSRSVGGAVEENEKLTRENNILRGDTSFMADVLISIIEPMRVLDMEEESESDSPIVQRLLEIKNRI